MSVELRLLKDAVTGLPFVPVTHWDAISNKPNIDSSLSAINASLDALDASVKALDASIKNIDIPIKSITGETGLTEYANNEFVAVSVSEPDENGNVNVDASIKVVTLADASNGIDGLASASDVYNNLSNAEEVMATVISKLNYTVGLDESTNLVWSEESGLTTDTIKEAIEYVSMNAGVKINDSSINESETWSSLKISDELNNIDIVQINDSSIDSSTVWSSQKVNNEILTVKGFPYLKFTANTAGSTIALSNYGGNAPDIKYSNDGVNWTQWDYSAITLTNVGDYVYMKGDNSQGFSSSDSKYSQFVMSGSIAGSGNIMSLIDNGACQTLTIPHNYCFHRLFFGCSSLTSAPELPATTLANNCYSLMFDGCSSLSSAPQLPATILVGYCYTYMFRDCTSLTSAPELPAIILASNCYNDMFSGCTSLTSAPKLLATTLAGGCYASMFRGCTSLTSAPELPATTLAIRCYSDMFYGCSRLNYIKCLAIGFDTNLSTPFWVFEVASTGTFIKNTNATWPTGNNGIPSGWNYINLSAKQTYENGHIYDSSVNSIVEGVLNGSINRTVVNQCVASGINSHAEGNGTQALNEAEHAEGKYNVSHSNTIHSIGIGIDSSRENAIEVLNNGDVYITGIGNYIGTDTNDQDSNIKPILEAVVQSDTVIKLWSGTQAQYDAIDIKDNATLYLIKD